MERAETSIVDGEGMADEATLAMAEDVLDAKVSG